MSFEEILKAISNQLLFVSCIIILVASLILTFKTRFVQFRMLPQMCASLFQLLKRRKNQQEGQSTIQAHKALFTAMSTTIGISTIVSPVIAIKLGGPGAIFGFLIATIFGCAVNFTEVTFALHYRKKASNGTILGGPMQYLHDEIRPFLAKWYAFFCLLLMVAWSSAQANQLADILSSPLLGSFHVSNYLTGIFLAIFVTCILIGGIKRIANFSEKLVPIMFFLYVGAGLWIVGCNLDKIPEIIQMVMKSALSPQSFASGAAVGGLASALRWGLFKGLQSNEAGIGTQTIPHSMAETDSPQQQGILSMTATYSAGFICILSSLITLMTGSWLDENLKLGIGMVADSFQSYFSFVGIIIVVISAFLFAFGTILGNSFNGSQCFNYLTNNRFVNYYYILTALVIFIGTISEVTLVWTVIDFFLIPVVIPHIISIVIIAYKRSDLLDMSLNMPKGRVLIDNE